MKNFKIMNRTVLDLENAKVKLISKTSSMLKKQVDLINSLFNFQFCPL